MLTQGTQVYHTKFSAMFYHIFPAVEIAKNPTEYKIVCAGPEERVVGLHILGDSSGEVSPSVPYESNCI
jgi:glutathione reductase (NADPH)